MADSADITALKAERSAVIGEMAAMRLLWMQSGNPLTGFDIGIDGENYQFAQWNVTKIKQLRDLTEVIRQMSAPWLVRTRSR